MKRELRRIEPKSVVRIAFFIGLLCGFLFGLYSSYMLREVAGTLLTPAEAQALGGLTGMSVIWTGVIMGLLGSLFFSGFGWLLSIVYNFLASRFGGIEYTVIESAESSGSMPHSDDPSRMSDHE